jgi:Leucine-rich repeat (LRR) protein
MTMPSSATLTCADLSGNRFTHLPLDVFSALPMVKVINFSENKLGEGQGWVSIDGQPLNSALSVLDISTNKVTGFLLGEIISNGNLAGLRELSASSNPLKIIDPILNQLTQLRILRLAYCGLEAIHPLDISFLPHMTTLDLSNNKLQTLHDRESDSPTNPFFKAVKLEFLSLENNGLREIPLELALLPKLTTLLVGGNPQRLIRPQVIQQGSAKVLETMRNRIGVIDGGKS